MGWFDFGSLFKKKEKSGDKDYTGSLGLDRSSLGSEHVSGYRTQAPPTIIPRSPQSQEEATQDNIRAKMDLIATQIDSMRVQQESINQRVVEIENIVKQLLAMSKS